MIGFENILLLCYAYLCVHISNDKTALILRNQSILNVLNMCVDKDGVITDTEKGKQFNEWYNHHNKRALYQEGVPYDY